MAARAVRQVFCRVDGVGKGGGPVAMGRCILPLAVHSIGTLHHVCVPVDFQDLRRRDPRFAEQTIHVGRVNEERGWNRVVPVLRYSLRFKEGDEKRAHCGGTTTCLCVPPLLDDTVAIHERKALDVPFVRLRLLVLIRGGRPESPEFHGIVA